MKSTFLNSINFWNSLLFISLIFTAFILPLWSTAGTLVFRLTYSVIYFTALFSLKKRSKKLILLFFLTIILEWVSGLLDAEVMYSIAKFFNIISFIVIVIQVIKQIANESEVNARMIFGSVTGYLLMGIIFSIFVAFIINNDPDAFNIPGKDTLQVNQATRTSASNYFVFVTMATLGYGDIVPMKPYSRSLATFIVIVGQFYIAIIVALLVGKFAAGRNESTDPADSS